MAINTYLSITESKKQNKWTSETKTIRECFDGFQMGGEIRGMGEKGEEIKKYKLVLTE